MGLLNRFFNSREAKFQKSVLDILNRHYPGNTFEPGNSDQSVRVNKVEVKLQHIFAVCQKNETQTEELVLQFFSHAVSLTEEPDASISWDLAQNLIRPQLFPAEYRERIPVISFSLTEDVSIGIVIKDEKRSPFIRKQNAVSWSVAEQVLYERSIQNLDSDKMEMEVTITDGTDRFIGMETHDGYDAARILLPRVRQFAAGKLGERFFAGMPNRNFLILWSKSCSKRFVDYAVEKIDTDFSIQPFPLSSKVFEATAGEDHSIPVITQTSAPPG